MSDPVLHYRLLEGVHRCVAAHMTGQTEIAACIDFDGHLGEKRMVPLTAIFSSKTEIGWRDRGRDFQVLLDRMANEEERGQLAPVELIVISPRGAKYLTRIEDVIVQGH